MTLILVKSERYGPDVPHAAAANRSSRGFEAHLRFRRPESLSVWGLVDARPRPGATNGSDYFKTSAMFTLVAGVGPCELSHCGARSPATKGNMADVCAGSLLAQVLAAAQARWCSGWLVGAPAPRPPNMVPVRCTAGCTGLSRSLFLACPVLPLISQCSTHLRAPSAVMHDDVRSFPDSLEKGRLY